MSESLKQAILIGAFAIVAFWVIKPKDSTKKSKSNSKKREKIPELIISDEDHYSSQKVQDAVIVMRAYIAAWNNDESDITLEALNQDTMKDFGMKAYWKGDKLAVKDKDGKDILVNK